MTQLHVHGGIVVFNNSTSGARAWCMRKFSKTFLKFVNATFFKRGLIGSIINHLIGKFYNFCGLHVSSFFVTSWLAA